MMFDHLIVTMAAFVAGFTLGVVAFECAIAAARARLADERRRLQEFPRDPDSWLRDQVEKHKRRTGL